jgi:hypothetical protein
MTTTGQASPVVSSAGGVAAPTGGAAPAGLGDVLERVLDRGLVIAGDIRVNLLDIELLTVKLRLVLASLETAKQVGMDWWEHDPWFTGRDGELQQENERLRSRVNELEELVGDTKVIEGGREEGGTDA